MTMAQAQKEQSKEREDPGAKLLATIQQQAERYLGMLMDRNPARFHEASGRIALALEMAIKSNPKILNADPASIAACLAMTCSTGLRPGGLRPECYLIPREQRVKPPAGSPKGTQWPTKTYLTWQISYHGYERLFANDGYTLRTLEIGRSDVFRPILPTDKAVGDVVTLDDGSQATLYRLVSGEFVVCRRNLDDPPASWPELRGVLVEITSQTGAKVYEYVSAKIIEKRARASETVKKAIEFMVRHKEGKVTDSRKREYWFEENRPSREGLHAASLLPLEEILAWSSDAPWKTWSERQARKTAIIYVAKSNVVPLSRETLEAIQGDEREPEDLTVDAESSETAAALGYEAKPATVLRPFGRASGMDDLMGVTAPPPESDDEEAAAD